MCWRLFNNRIIKVSSSNFLLVGDSLMGKARTKASQVALVVKNLPAKARDRDLGLIPGWGRSPGGGNGNPLQHSCQDNPRDRGAEEPGIGSQRVRYN